MKNKLKEEINQLKKQVKEFEKRPSVCLDEYSIQFEFQNGGRALELEFTKEGIIEYLKEKEDDKTEKGSFTFNNFNKINDLIKWVDKIDQ
ncbi:MAG: hypothetical protein ACOCP8_07295 [archaeon]